MELNFENFKASDLLLLLQSLFYITTGVWPLLHYASFERVTGPKVDVWLVKTVGWLLSTSGGCFLLAALGRSSSFAVYFLALSQAVVMGTVDVHYVKKKIISKVYLYDAAAEYLLVTLWVVVLGRSFLFIP